MRADSSIGRRTVLRAAAGAVASASVLSTRVAAQKSGYGDWFDGVGNFDGTVDRRGEDAVTVEVGVDANGGPFGFGPAAVRVDPGTTVTFEWVSDNHNVVLEEGPEGTAFEGHGPIENTGFSFEHTFETEGIHLYYCEPHRSLGMKGAVVVGDAEVGTPTPGGDGGGGAVEPDWGNWFSDVGNYGTTDDLRGRDAVTIRVGTQGNGGPFAFDPPAVWIDPGTTVTFEWVSDNHNVVLEEGPDGTAFEGHGPIENTGFTFEHTFETGGVYEYFCEPHLSLGMKGGIAVGDDVPTVSAGGPADGGGADGERPFAPPGGEIGFAFVLITLGAAGLAVLSALAGEFYRFSRRPAPEEAAEEPGIVREIGHDEFDPVGTATLIVIYFLILVVMWVFVYFVEFLGRGPTVIG